VDRRGLIVGRIRRAGVLPIPYVFPTYTSYAISPYLSRGFFIFLRVLGMKGFEGRFQETRAAGRYLRDPSPPPGSDPEHGDSALGLAVKARDRHAGAAVSAPEGTLDLGSGGGLSVEKEHRRVSLCSLDRSSDLGVNRLESGSRVSSSDLTSGDAGEKGSAEGVRVGDLNRCGTVRAISALALQSLSTGARVPARLRTKRLAIVQLRGEGFVIGSLSPSHFYNVTR
jgi:hypothetical protein